MSGDEGAARFEASGVLEENSVAASEVSIVRKQDGGDGVASGEALAASED